MTLFAMSDILYLELSMLFDPQLPWFILWLSLVLVAEPSSWTKLVALVMKQSWVTVLHILLEYMTAYTMKMLELVA